MQVGVHGGAYGLLFGFELVHWVAIGAVVTILLLAFEPFLQVIISFVGQMDPTAGSLAPYIGRSELLDVGSYFGDGTASMRSIRLTPSNSSVTFEPFKSQPDLGMLAAFNNGFYNSSAATQQATSFTCPTANCTWPLFTSLAMCSACNDVTSHLQRYKKYGSNLGTLFSHDIGVKTNYTINALPRVNLTNYSDLNGTDRGLVSFSAYMAATAITDSKLTLTFQSLNTMVTAVQVLRAAAGYETEGLIWDETNVTATECALFFYVNAYESVVQKGVLTERIVGSWSERDPASYQDTSGAHDFDQYEEWNNHSLYSESGDFVRSDLELFIPQSDAEAYTLPENMTSRFRLTERTVGSTTHFVNEQLLKESMAFPFKGQPTRGQPPVGQSLYQSNNLSATFDKVAWTVSNWMRDISNVTHSGNGTEWVIHIHVKWPYISLPLLTSIVGLLFVLLSILDTRKLQLSPFKTDMIAALTHSVDAETRAQLRFADRHGHLDDTIKAMTVSLEDTGAGLELKAKQA
ncbi:hypothetical protein F5B20DRAFT_557630 [Whalleya microplaca]|nr:hypothetical protein F5B20DRAFT_557630 [Whalleya microplaca]